MPFISYLNLPLAVVFDPCIRSYIPHLFVLPTDEGVGVAGVTVQQQPQWYTG